MRQPPIVALDCEMVGASHAEHDDILARVSVVDCDGQVLLDTFVKPSRKVVDYREEITGLTAEDLRCGRQLQAVRRQVAAHLKGSILVGHAVEHDLGILGLTHPQDMVRDTADFQPLRFSNPHRRPKLRDLAQYWLGWEIQQPHHSSVEDALASMKLYLLFQVAWESLPMAHEPCHFRMMVAPWVAQ
eukprot:GGOE01060841.1.p1 GENE.GGOE01060841.1~~GGOE01060841.1.p1  ORF type:complete len:195 (-),score=38.17 GGOE01060841.1:91-651(-)